MFTYWSRLIDRYQVDVVSLAVLADTSQNYRPSAFYFEAVKAVEKQLKMPYINTVEQYGIEQGIEKEIEKQREKTARNMVLQTELNDQTIAAITELSIK